MDLVDLGSHGAYRSQDLLDVFGRRCLRKAVAAGELRPLWRGVLVDTRRFVDPWTRAAAGLIVAGPDAAVSDATAAVLHGCRAIEPDATHLVVPPGKDAPNRAGLRIHHRGFYADDVIELDGLRVLNLDRVTSDLICSARPQDGLALADQVLRAAKGDHEVTRRRIAEVMRRRKDPRGSVRGALLLDLASPHARSPAESWFRFHLVDLGFPVPEVNWPLVGLDGELVCVLDLAWPSLRILVEYDGYEAHVDRGEADARREEDLRRRGWIVIRASRDDLRDMSRVDRELRAAFARRGYSW